MHFILVNSWQFLLTISKNLAIRENLLKSLNLSDAKMKQLKVYFKLFVKKGTLAQRVTFALFLEYIHANI